MKKFALISGVLFLVVYFWVNTFTKDENSFEMVYPSMNVSSLAETKKLELPAMDDVAPVDQVSVRAPSAYIIIASFGDLEQARKTADAYTAQSHADIFILPPTSTGFYRISYGRYSSAGEAEGALENVRQSGFPDAWLLAPE